MQDTHTPEYWLPVKGWEDVYHISNIGRVKRIKLDGHGAGLNRILSPVAANGYFKVRLRDNGRSGYPMLHVLLARAFIGEPPTKKHEVNHKDGNKGNYAISNLEWVTRSENQLHSYRILRRVKVSNKGEAAGRAKLSNNQVIEIRRRYSDGGVTIQALATEYGMALSTVGGIILRKNWKHI